MNCFGGSGLGQVYRCDLSRGDDLLGYLGYPGQTPWLQVLGNYLHDPSFWCNDPGRASDPSAPGWTHNDLVQCAGSKNGRIIGNSMHAYADPTSGMPSVLQQRYPSGQTNSCIMLTISSGRHTGLAIQKNWTYGGMSQIQMPYQDNSYRSGNSWDISDNRFGLSCVGFGPYSQTYSYQVVRWGDVGPTAGSVHDNIWNEEDSITPPQLRGRSTGGAAATGLDYRTVSKISGT